MQTPPRSILRSALAKITAPEVAPWVGFGCCFVAIVGKVTQSIVEVEWRPDGPLGHILLLAIFNAGVAPRLSTVLTVTILFLTALLFIGGPYADNLGLIAIVVMTILVFIRTKEIAAEARAAKEGG